MKARNRILSMLLTLALVGGLFGGGFSLPALAAENTEVTDLTTNFLENPLGIETDNLRFGWKMDSNVIGNEQDAYRIVIREADPEDGDIVWDSGTVESGLSSSVPYGGDYGVFRLETRYYWTVTVTDTYGNSYSGSAWFETGADWSGAQWISTEGWKNSTYTMEEVVDQFTGKVTYRYDVVTDGADAPLFRTQQALTGTDVASARLYITSLGSYEAYIDGQEVQGEVDAMLAPGWTDYGDYVNYQTYDVTDYISGPDITLSAIVSAGWYGGEMNQTSNYESAIGQEGVCERSLYAKLVIQYENGDEQVIVTDASTWETSDTLSPYTTTGIYEGEVYDGAQALAIDGWNRADYDTTNGDWQTAVSIGDYTGEVKASSVGLAYDYALLPLVSAYTYNADTDILTQAQGSEYKNGEIDPAKATYYGDGESITLKEGDTLVLDFGQNASAVPVLTISGDAGTDVYMQPSEVVSDGNTSNLAKGVIYPSATADRSWHYLLSGNGVETYRAQMHFCGFQYLRITATGDITIHSAKSQTISSLSTETTEVDSSNDTLNQFISNVKWSQLSNFLTVMTDCPTREYRGWEGDAQLFANTAMYNFDSAAFMAHYIEIIDYYFEQNGTYSCLAPGSTDYAFDTSSVAGWSDAGIILPYVYYQYTGDISVAEKYWDNLSAFTDNIYTGTTFDQDNFESGYGGYLQWGDHLSLRSASTNFLNLAFTLYDSILMEKMALALGYTEDAAKYAERVDHVRAFMIERYIDESGNVLCATADPGSSPMIGGTVVDNAQTAVSWAIVLSLYETEAQEQGLAENLVASVKNENGSVRPGYAENTLECGFLGINILLPALSEIGEVSTAYDLMLNTSVYSPLYSASVGGTTTWESWNGWTEESGYDSNSKNHFSYGAPAQWVYEYAAGIQKDEDSPGFKHFILQPELSDALTYLNTSYESYYGSITSNWRASGGELTAYEAVVPANSTATLYLPVGASALDNFEEIMGVTYVGMTVNNGLEVAEFELLSGGYAFTVENGSLVVSLLDGYTEPVLTVTASAYQGGTVDPAQAEVTYGEDVAITVKADEGSKLAAILVNGLTVDLAGIENDVYTLENVKRNTTVRALFVPDQAEDFAARFDDVSSSDWFYDEVDMLAGLVVVRGVSDNEFDPERDTRRSEFAQLMFNLATALGVDPQENTDVPFTDLPDDYWATGVIGWAYQMGFIQGHNESEFGPEDPISREDMALAFYRFLAESLGYELEGDTAIDFTDAEDINDWAEDAVNYVVRTGLMQGYEDGGAWTFQPQKSTYRNEIATLFYNYLIYTD